MPALFVEPVLAGEVRAAGVRQMWPPDVSDSGHDLPGHAQAADGLVSRDVLGHHPEKRGQCTRPTAGARIEELQDRLDLAAQIASRDGPAGARPAPGPGRGGRDLHCRRR